MRAGIAGHEPHDHVERGRLAGAVRPEQAHDLALVHVDREPSDDCDGICSSSRGRRPSVRSSWSGRALVVRLGGFGRAAGTPGGRLAGDRRAGVGAGVVVTFLGSFDAARGSMVRRTRWPPGVEDAFSCCFTRSYCSFVLLISRLPSHTQAFSVRSTVPWPSSYTIWPGAAVGGGVRIRALLLELRRLARDGHAIDLVVAEADDRLVRAQAALRRIHA